MAKFTAQQIRDGIFALNTRRFGTVAETLIKILANTSWGKDPFHDLYDEAELKRIEVKFSRALRSHDATIREDNVLEQIVSADDKSRMFKSSQWKKHRFDCNIQQVKPREFDILYYGIFFSNKVMIFKINVSDIGKSIRYSDKQHKGNIGEGQFHLNQDTYEHHLKRHFEAELTYSQVLKLLLKLQRTHKGVTIRSMLMSLIV